MTALRDALDRRDAAALRDAIALRDATDRRDAAALRDAIGRRGGLAATHELYEDGWGRATLTKAVRRGEIIRVRQGWYGRRDLHATLVRAARVGGPATCVTGLELAGMWVIRDAAVHVRVPAHGSRLRDPRDSRRRLGTGAVPHWSANTPGSRLLLDPIQSLEDMLGCRPVEQVAAAADSVLRERPALRLRWEALLQKAPERARPMLRMVDGICESGTETMAWLRLGRHLGWRRQVPIPGVGRVDFVHGERLVIEIDGFEYHSDRRQFEDDRHRDAALSVLGYRVLRFSYRQVLEHWADVQSAILAARARGDHL